MATVLAVDDHPDSRRVLVRMLEMHGHQVKQCESGEEALRHLNVATPDAIIIDDRMSGMTGMETVRHIRKDVRFAKLFVIVWSADANCQIKAEQGGADEFWVKGSEAIFEQVAELNEKLQARQGRAGKPPA